MSGNIPPSIRGIGTDIVEVSRISKALERHGQRFLDRTFSTREQAYCHSHSQASRHLAGRWAAKEAVAKALGTGFGQDLGWLDIEILNDDRGKPEAYLSPEATRAHGSPVILISISHCHDYATATAILY